MWRVHKKTSLTLAISFLLAVMTIFASGCGGDVKDAQIPYPAQLSANSSPTEVAEVLIEGLDAENNEMLIGLVAVKSGTKAIEDIYIKHGRKPQIDYNKTAALAVAGWQLTYAFFEAGSTEVQEEQIDGETAVIYALGRNASTGEDQYLDINLIREDNLWKVKPGLQSRLR